MQLATLPGRPHLTYCTNIHAGESWSEIRESLAKHLPEVKRRVSPQAPMGVGLRLSGPAAAELAGSRQQLRTLADFLADEALYVFTINAFPYGAFHGREVKARVYQPDWRDPLSVAYSNDAADVLAALLPDGMEGSVSTVPGAFKAALAASDDVSSIAANMVRHAAHLDAIATRTGKIIALAIEPEPCCLLETTGEAIAFFRDHLFGSDAVARMRGLRGLSESDAEATLRRHLGLCFDVCHGAVEFEDAASSFASIEEAGIVLAKLQLSSAIRVADIGAANTEASLASFDDGVYLHQTVERRGECLTRHADLPDAFAALRRGEAGGEWRVHCHVPVFLDSFDGIGSTQEALKDVLALCRKQAVSPHLEIETYTWSVLPPSLRNGDLSGDIAREVEWVRSQLGA